MKIRPRDHRYGVTVTWVGPATGSTTTYAGYSREHAISFEGKDTFLHGSSDPVFRGDRSLINPEELLVASLAACHMLAYLALCAHARIEILSYVDRAHGEMRETGGAGRFVSVTLLPDVRIAHEADRLQAVSLHDRAREDCFIANSVNFPVYHEPSVRT
jgi:organic hydroperoxide reductase OsmC/OhrA